MVTFSPLRRLGAPLLAAGAFAGASVLASATATGFQLLPVDQSMFVLLAAPIGESGQKSMLNIWEQVPGRRTCFSVLPGKPALVDLHLRTFNWDGICRRFLDSNSYSVRVGERELGTVYRLTVVRRGGDNLLMAYPTRSSAGPEMLVARTGGHAAGNLNFELEPGWSLRRRSAAGRALGHVYLYRDDFPAGTTAAVGTPAAAGTPAAGSSTQPGTPATPTGTTAPGAKPTPLSSTTGVPASGAAPVPPAPPAVRPGSATPRR